MPHKATCGAGIAAGGSVELPSYPYPIFMAYASQPADLVYSLTKAMIVDYDAYKDGAPGAAGLDVKRQNFAWVVPYHEGAVKALKEAGVWKAEHEAHNQKLAQAPGRRWRRRGTRSSRAIRPTTRTPSPRPGWRRARRR